MGKASHAITGNGRHVRLYDETMANGRTGDLRRPKTPHLLRRLPAEHEYPLKPAL